MGVGTDRRGRGRRRVRDLEVKAPRNAYPTAVALYAALLPGLREVAHVKGYALAVHGSMTTDFDLVAVPWVPDAVSADELIEALREHVGGRVNPKNPMRCRGCTERALEHCAHVDDNPSLRAHGRLAWAIHLGPGESGPYLDVSVMPLARQ